MINKRYILILFFIITCTGKLFAQYVPSWGGGADQQDFSFGFTFQFVNADFKIVKDQNWRRPFRDTEYPYHNVTDSLNSMSSKSTPGFAIGFVSRYSLNDHIEIRSTPLLSFTDKRINYEYQTDKYSQEKQVQNTSVDIPLSLKLKSDRIADFRLYLIGGIKYTFNINKKPNQADIGYLDKKLQLVRNYASYEAGIGCDIYFEYFKLSPELKLANSFGDVLLHENHPFAVPISKLFLHTIMFSLTFE
ncbi:type IX secretion/gliding motility protein PorT/SprT [Mucilaginibacter sp. KACC 22063]|uniref:type IX secretion/gliding motility protein PorT/SprT n=1 Tax=Mucilaginibacter sp. KACC 22063 TaxID=3025666 RepID=UPI00236706F4|nr:outer membrane beta-barrel protein [Mucilaginibacter sp. KACC 22063]WDF56823.1 outer membrane beta-barrel protein [Mucilaginibacter sp. KACC 22063]